MATLNPTPAKLIPITVLTNSLVAVFTCPLGVNGAVMKKVTFTNTTSGALTVQVNFVPNGGSAATGNIVMDNVSIPAKGTTYIANELNGLTFLPGDALQALAASGASINLIGSGYTF